MGLSRILWPDSSSRKATRQYCFHGTAWDRVARIVSLCWFSDFCDRHRIWAIGDQPWPWAWATYVGPYGLLLIFQLQCQAPGHSLQRWWGSNTQHLASMPPATQDGRSLHSFPDSTRCVGQSFRVATRLLPRLSWLLFSDVNRHFYFMSSLAAIDIAIGCYIIDIGCAGSVLNQATWGTEGQTFLPKWGCSSHLSSSPLPGLLQGMVCRRWGRWGGGGRCQLWEIPFSE